MEDLHAIISTMSGCNAHGSKNIIAAGVSGIAPALTCRWRDEACSFAFADEKRKASGC